MGSDKITMAKLTGSANYPIWALRMAAFLTKESLNAVITADEVSDDINGKALSNIQLLVEDGPLLQIQHITRAHEAWESLKNLYSPKGFSSEFLICREFFDTHMLKYNSMEEYLNKVKQLSDQLKAKNLELPKQVIIAWVLNNLTDNYDGLVSNITQSLRTNIDSYTLETLFSNLLDESKRQESNEANTDQALITGGYKGKKPYKITKSGSSGANKKYCTNCKQHSHITSNCAFLFPDKAPKGWKKPGGDTNKSPDKPEKLAREKRDDNIDVLYSTANTALDIGDFVIDFDVPMEDMVFITIPLKTNKITNIDNIGTNPVNMQETRKSGVYSQLNIFALDTAATKHICCDLSYFSNFKTCNKIVNWGKAKQISIKGYGNILIKSNINNKKYMLKDCLYMPELGINLISQS